MIRRLSLVCVVALLVVPAFTGMAQESSSGIPIQFAGRIASIEGTTLTVNQLRIDVSGAEVSTALQVDAQIVIRGILHDSAIITAQTVSIYLPPSPTETPVVPTPAALPATLDPAILSLVEQTPVSMVIEGEVQAIEDGRLWVNGMSFEYDADDPIFEDLQVGDVLRIEGSAVQIGDTQAITVTDISVIERASDESDEEENDQPEGMGMGMGEGMGD